MACSNDVAILNISDANASFKSVVNETSFIDLPLAVPNGSSADANINKRNKWGLILLLVSLIGCVSVLIYLCVRVEYVANFSGQVDTNLPILGNVSFNVTLEGELSLSSKLSSLTPNNTLWQQTYVGF